MDRRMDGTASQRTQNYFCVSSCDPSGLTPVPASLLGQTGAQRGLGKAPGAANHGRSHRPWMSPRPGCPQPLRPSRVGVPGRGRGKDLALPELCRPQSRPHPLPAPQQHIWDTPGAFKAVSGERRKARLNSWPEMKGKLSLGGWNEFPVLRSGLQGPISCAAFPEGLRRTFPARKGSGLPEGLPGCSMGWGG